MKNLKDGMLTKKVLACIAEIAGECQATLEERLTALHEISAKAKYQANLLIQEELIRLQEQLKDKGK